MSNKAKVTVTYEVTVFDYAKRKYPNFDLNFESIEQMARAIALSLGHESETERYGYRIKLVSLDTDK